MGPKLFCRIASGCLVAASVVGAPSARAEAPSLSSTRPTLTKGHAPEKAASTHSGTFELGSYGRVRFASDLRGGTGRTSNIVAHGSRMDEESYVELELRREDLFAGKYRTKAVLTMAFFAPLFHFTGKVDQAIALRNAYAQASFDGYTLWAGSRMYRGDDIYLLDWWPLDNQNTLGGGVGGTWGGFSAQLHVGMQRLESPYQYQQIKAVAPYTSGTTDVLYLDRPRIVETAKLIYQHKLGDGKSGLKFVLYGEAHQISAGVYRDESLQQDRSLPRDTGVLVGAQATYYTGERDGHVHLFARHGRGLAAYDPLGSPATFANDRTTSGATDTYVALSGNYEVGMFALMAAGYLRMFRDGGAETSGLQNFDEGALVLRPQVYFGQHFGIGLEGSLQTRRFGMLDASGDSQLTATVLRGGIMPFFTPAGRGSYKRPHIRAIYTVTARNSGTRSLYPKEDFFATRGVEHFLGLGAEWWFNSSSYP